MHHFTILLLLRLNLARSVIRFGLYSTYVGQMRVLVSIEEAVLMFHSTLFHDDGNLVCEKKSRKRRGKTKMRRFGVNIDHYYK